MTVTFMLKIANLVSVAAEGFRVFHKLVLFLLNLGFMSKSISDSPSRYVFFDIVLLSFFALIITDVAQMNDIDSLLFMVQLSQLQTHISWEGFLFQNFIRISHIHTIHDD